MRTERNWGSRGLTIGSRRSRGYGGRVNLTGSILPANEHKLSKDVNGVTTGISRTQTTIKYLGHIFGGLRDVEMDSLPLDCLKISTSSGRKHYLIEGDPT